MEGNIIAGIVMVSLLGIMLVSGVPIAFVLFSVGLFGCLVWIGSESIPQMIQFLLNTTSSDILVCLPLFLFMAELMVVSEVGHDLFDGMKIWSGRFRGGLAIMSLIGCALFGAISGSSAANIAAVGTVALWEMNRLGYSKTLACGVVSTGGMLDVLIPPSVLMVIYGSLTDQSIGKLFVAAVVPGIILTIFCLLTIIVWCFLRPEAAPVPDRRVVPLKEKIRVTYKIIPYVIIFSGMFYAFYTGIATPTEVAGIGVLATFIVALFLRRLTLHKVMEASTRAGLSTAFILFVIAGAKFFAFVITASGISFVLNEWVVGLGLTPVKLILVMTVLYLIMGCFIDAAGAMTLTLPFFLPLLTSLNIDLIWFGILTTVTLELGYVTPPFGINLFILRGVAPPGTTMKEIIGGNVPFYVATGIMLVLLILFPEIATWLPSLK